MDKNLLFKPATPEEDVDIPGRGVVRVRGFTRAELHAMTASSDWDRDAAAAERMMLAVGLVDPALTEEEVGRWQAAATAGEIGLVIGVIGRLSGMDQDAAKSLLPGV